MKFEFGNTVVLVSSYEEKNAVLEKARKDGYKVGMSTPDSYKEFPLVGLSNGTNLVTGYHRDAFIYSPENVISFEEWIRVVHDDKVKFDTSLLNDLL